jgi:type VI secretion system secreted protein Hcp
MALTGYLYAEGSSSGIIKGDCNQAGREGAILVYAFEHKIEIPKDTHTGLPTGQRVHHPFTIVKRVDNATPLIMQACTSGEQLKKWELHLYRINEKGQEEHYYTIKLTEAIIVEVKLETPPTFLPENKPYHNMERVSFTYAGIDHEHKIDSVLGSDNWKQPKS